MAGACSPGDDDLHGEIAYRTSLVQYGTCSALEADLKQLLINEIETNFDQAGWWGPWPIEDAPANGDTSTGGDGRQEGTDYSGTNNQEEGVDESDFVKTDGYHIYMLNGNRLHIFGVPEFGELIPESEFDIEGMPIQMLVDSEANKAIVFSYVWTYALPEDHPLRGLVGFQEGENWMWRTGELSKITVINIADRTAPTLDRELFIEGNFQTARKVEGTVRMGAYSWMYIPGLYDWWWYYGQDGSMEQAKERAKARVRALELADMIPFIYERRPGGTVITHSLSQNSCSSFYRPENSHGRGFTSILSLDLSSEGLSFDADHVVSNWSTLYSSSDYMYIAESANDWWWFWWNQDHPEQLNVHMFDIRRPGRSSYLGSGRVEGALLNQFSLDEHQGYLRVATTTDRWARWWLENPPPSENHLFVLGRQGNELVEVGHLGGIASGESIFAARMIGDKGYIVTFEQIDPLFTLDLSDPTNPRVVGELELPGFSTYIHPLAQDKLLTIGVGGDENGANWLTQISLFDVSDFANPSIVDQHTLAQSGEWGWSEALYEHKAFQYWAPKNLLAVPLSSYRSVGDTWEYSSTLELITVDLDAGLSSYGTIDHSSLYNSDPESYWYYRDIRRSIFMGDFIYAISDRGITVHNLNDVPTVVADASLPGYDPYDWYWWW
jgi:hypothetical protein